MKADEDLLKRHYADLSGRPFFAGLIQYMQLGPVVPMVWEGLNVVKTGRQLLGETNPADSKPGTIRGDFCIQTGRYYILTFRDSLSLHLIIKNIIIFITLSLET